MKDILQASFICRVFGHIFAWFDRQIENSVIITAFLKPVKGRESAESSIFYKLWELIHRFIAFVYEKLNLEKILNGSIFTNTYFWSALACTLAPILPTTFAIAAVCLSVLAFFIGFARDRNKRLRYTPANKYILFFCGVYVFAVATSLSFREGLAGGLVFIFFTFFAIVVGSVITSRKRLYTVVNLMVFSGVAVSAYGIAQYVLGMTGSLDWLDSEMFDGISMRVYSTLQNPNVLAEYLLLTIPLTVGCFFKYKGAGRKLIYGASAAIMGVCMILTFSRGGWLGLLFAAAVFLVLLDKRFVFLGIAALVGLYFVLPQSVIERFASIGNMADTSTAYRVYIWMGTVKMLKDYWLCGTGFGQAAFSKVYPAYALHAVSAPHAHNLFLQITCDCGIVGLIFFIIILFLFFKTLCGAASRTKDKELRYMLLGFISAVCGFLVQSMTDYTFYNYRVMLMFWAVMGIGLAAASLAEKREGEKEND